MFILDLERLETALICYTWSSFEMTVESSYPSAIATLSDWPKNLAPVFQPMRSKTKTKTKCALYARLCLRFEQVTSNCLEFWLVHRAVCSCCNWSESFLWYWFFDSHFKTVLKQTCILELHSHYLCRCLCVRFLLQALATVYLLLP